MERLLSMKHRVDPMNVFRDNVDFGKFDQN
ncbi:hypothetical protein FVP33_18580 [Lacisediminihabitans profunda]|uniref:Uncharacterized protein n=1 Tax=Lacisediminihabitans profunda TaxID=2594790 RepID=A0A5C8UK93_9MICO|nr:hypothetical protein FVP33_18580 [Lacisediminihabitans profunda]